MRLAFRDYLEAKFPLDERSLNPGVRDLFLAELRGRESSKILDLGCGAGATLRRLLAANLPVSFELTAVDRDPALLEVARASALDELQSRDFSVALREGAIRAERRSQRVTVHFLAADARDFRPEPPDRFDAVIAHALMDLLPAPLMAGRILDWLEPAGLFYAALNYDAGTTLFPAYPDPALEAAILARYDASMDRTLDGLTCGGAHSGRRLHAALFAAGYHLLAYGSSDWNITPHAGSYRDADARCLTALLAMIHREAYRSGEFDPDALTAWKAQRQALLQSCDLGLIIHQLDILARKPASSPPA